MFDVYAIVCGEEGNPPGKTTRAQDGVKTAESDTP